MKFFKYVVLSYLTQHPIFLILSYTGIFINLFNLVPIRPLDGGRVLQISSLHIKYLGLLILLAMIISFQAVGLILILLVSLPDFMKPTKTRLILSCVVYAAMIVGFILFPQGWILTCVDLLLGGCLSDA
jgi:Zn-dependent protease